MRNTSFTSRPQNKYKLKPSKQRRYDSKTGLWIAKNKNVFLCWFLFLKEAEKDPARKVKWEFYKGWGDSEVVSSQSFDSWWDERWEFLFGYKTGDHPLYKTTTRQVNFRGCYDAYVVYQYRDLPNKEIAELLFTKSDPYGRSTNRKWDDVQISQSRISRYLSRAEEILDNVCEGKFP